jgi:hypothetical protein
VKWDKNLPIETQISPWEIEMKKRPQVRILPDVGTKRPCGQVCREITKGKRQKLVSGKPKKFSSFIMLTPRPRNHLPL